MGLEEGFVVVVDVAIDAILKVQPQVPVSSATEVQRWVEAAREKLWQCEYRRIVVWCCYVPIFAGTPVQQIFESPQGDSYSSLET